MAPPQQAADAAIELTSVGKRYWKLEEQAMLLRSLLPFMRPKRSEMWALRGIDFSIAQGEVVGILGRNGAGKTTMLRLMAGVTRPTEGRLTIRGRVAPLISVGVGFHKEMSGRENVYVNGMLLGLTKEEIDARFDSIVDFAELADFIDTPVKFYSSGMFMRLGFAVAVHTDPQVLLVDEVLAVGDLAFQSKCFEKMKEFKEKGCTVVVVSHSAQLIRLVCDRGIVMRRGAVDFDGDVDHAIARHYELMSMTAGSIGSEDEEKATGARVIRAELASDQGTVHYVEPGTPLTLRVAFEFDREAVNPIFNVAIMSDEGSTVYGVRTPLQYEYRTFQPGDVAEMEVRFTARLGGGNYRVTYAVHSHDSREHYCIDQQGLVFFVPVQDLTYGLADLGGRLTLDGRELEVEPQPTAGNG